MWSLLAISAITRRPIELLRRLDGVCAIFLANLSAPLGEFLEQEGQMRVG
jgi:hypothetical protein